LSRRTQTGGRVARLNGPVVGSLPFCHVTIRGEFTPSRFKKFAASDWGTQRVVELPVRRTVRP
jgi:hypothetical protein